jgi:hypothetical protein
MSDASISRRDPEMRQKRQRLTYLKARIQQLRDELSALKEEQKQLRSEVPSKATSGERSAPP